MKKLLTIILSLLVVAGACVFTTEVKAEAGTAKLSKKSVKLEVGDSKKIKVKGTKTKAVWSSSDEKVATVKNGKITAKAEGTCKIVATVGKKKLTCKVTVNAKQTVAFDSTVKIGNATIPMKGSWESSGVMSEGTSGLSMVVYAESTGDNVRTIIYEVIDVPGEYADLTKEDFKLVGEAFAESFSATSGVEDIKTDITEESGVFYGKVTGIATSSGVKLPMAMTYKIENGTFVATVVMELQDKLSSDAADLAFEACKGAKIAKTAK